MHAPLQSTPQAEAEARLHFEMLLADICAEFVNVTPDALDFKIENAQRVICEALEVDHSSVWQVLGGNPDTLVMTHTYRDPTLKPLPLSPVLEDYFPWSRSKILKKEIVSIPNTADVPPEAARDKESWLKYDIHSTLAFPLTGGDGEVIGLLAFDSTKEQDWTEPLRRRLQILALVFAQALDRKNSLQKARESENRFRLVANTAPVLIWMSGTDKLCTYFNKPWLDFTGRSIEQELGNGWVDGVHPEDMQRCLDTYTHAFDERKEFKMEYRLRHRDGEYRWIFDIGVPRFNRDGSFAGYIGSVVDITEHKLAEQERLLSENRFQQFFEALPEYCYMVSSEGEIVDVNLAACSALGYRKDELVGKPLSILYAPEYHPKMRELFTKWKTDGKLRNEEMVVITKDGQRRTVLLNVGSVKDSYGNAINSTSVQVDITERKIAEEALLASEERLTLAQKVARIGTFEWNIKTGVNTWTPELETMYGLPRANFGKTEAAFENRVHPDDRAKVKRLRDYALKSGQPTEGEWRVVWDDGSVHWIAGRWQVFVNESGEAVRMIGVNIDVTQRKQAEEALLAVNSRLIEAQEQERARIGRELHDDINQRLAILTIQLEQLRDNPSDIEHRVQKLREEIIEIASDVQALSHELHASKLEYLGAVGGMKSWCKEFGERQRMHVDFRPDVRSPLPPDTGLCLFRVLQEALHNASKHSGVRRVDVRLREDSGEIHLIVSDLGKGFDIEAAMQGHGIGLTSMQERVRLVNGTITIDSKPSRGTTIHVRVPLGWAKDSQQKAV